MKNAAFPGNIYTNKYNISHKQITIICAAVKKLTINYDTGYIKINRNQKQLLITHRLKK